MKFIISEQQSNFLLHDLLDEMFEDHYLVWSKGGERLIFVKDKLMMVLNPTKAILSKDILEKVQGVLFYDSMNDFKKSVREWFLNHFPVSINNANMYGFTFKDLSNYIQK